MTAEKPEVRNGAASEVRMLVDGKGVPALDGQTFDVVSPVDGRIVARVAKGGPADVDRAVAAAQEAFDGEWHTWSQTRRGQALQRLAQARLKSPGVTDRESPAPQPLDQRLCHESRCQIAEERLACSVA